MKFTCSQSDLAAHLALAGRAIASRPTHPVMANVLVEALISSQTSAIVLTGFDGNLGIRVMVDADVKSPGRVTLPARLLTDIVSKLPQGDVTLTITEKDDSISAEIKSTSGKYKIQGMSADEFPELPEVDGPQATLPYDAVIEGLQGTLFAASTDEAKQVLTGVHITIGKSIEFAATDGHRLSVVSATGENATATAMDVTIPASALREVQRMVQAQKQAVTVQFNEQLAVFECGTQRLTTRLLEGQYPNYQQLIPKQFSTTATLDRASLLASLGRVAVLADQKNNVVKLKFSDDSVELKADAADVGSGEETLPCTTTGDLEIAFNVKYLADGLKAIGTNEVLMSMNSPTSPVVIQPVGGAKMQYLIMPVQVRS